MQAAVRQGLAGVPGAPRPRGPVLRSTLSNQARASQACTERIKRDHSGEAHCTGQYFDYWSCIDKCVRARFLLQAQTSLACACLTLLHGVPRRLRLSCLRD